MNNFMATAAPFQSAEGWIVPERITPEWVSLAVDQLYDMSDDFATFSRYEHQLYIIVLEAIAEQSCDNPHLCAHIALEGLAIECAGSRG